MPTLFQIKTFLTYWLEAVDGHSLHSPFLFDFYINVVKHKNQSDFIHFEAIRNKLTHDERDVTYPDLGSGSRHSNSSTRKIKHIAKTSLSSSKYSMLYNRIVKHYKAKSVIELGTSLGINSLYMSSNDGVQLTTFEGSAPIARIARNTFELAKVTNVRLIEGNLDHSLPNFLQTSEKIDVAFLDANHRYQPTKQYFELILPKTHHRSIMILDDIHYSKEMEQAWKEIQEHPLVYGSADLYRCGILFFDPSLNKQNVVLQFNN